MDDRVNAIAPGPVDTPQFRRECEANKEQLWLDAQATYVGVLMRRFVSSS